MKNTSPEYRTRPSISKIQGALAIGSAVQPKSEQNCLALFCHTSMTVGPVRDSLKEVDENTWLIDDRLLLRRSQSLDFSECLWKDHKGWHFTITDATTPPPIASPLPSDSFPKLIYAVGYGSAVYDLGDALLRVKRRHPFPSITPEPETLRWLVDRKPSFTVPVCLYYTEDVERIYSIVSRVPGRSIEEAWRDLNNEQKEQCITRVAQICLEMSAWTSETITGVDGNRLFDPWLCNDNDLSPDSLLRNCQLMQMDTSTLVFNHNDLGPTNIMVDVDKNCEIGIVDWEMAGFVPFTWVRTKLTACYGMDFSWDDVDPSDPSMSEWRRRLADELGNRNVPCVAEQFLSWMK